MTPETEALIARVLAHDDRTDAPKLARMLKQAIGALCLTVTVKDSGGALTALRETTLAEIEKIAREGA